MSQFTKKYGMEQEIDSIEFATREDTSITISGKFLSCILADKCKHFYEQIV